MPPPRGGWLEHLRLLRDKTAGPGLSSELRDLSGLALASGADTGYHAPRFSQEGGGKCRTCRSPGSKGARPTRNAKSRSALRRRWKKTAAPSAKTFTFLSWMFRRRITPKPESWSRTRSTRREFRDDGKTLC